MITLTLSPVTPAKAKAATAALRSFYEEGNFLSNRTNVPRVVGTLAAALTVVQTGKAVEVTDLFPTSNGAPLYNVAHRVLSVGAIRPYWGTVRIVVLKDWTDTVKTVTGTPSSTARAGRVFLAPVE